MSKVDSVDKTGNDVEKISNTNFNENDKATEEVVSNSKCSDKNMVLPDKVCTNEEYETATVIKEAKSFRSVDILPEKYTLDGFEGFRAMVEEYFENRKDVLERVINVKW